MKRTTIVIWSGVGLCAFCCLLTVLAALHVWFSTTLTGSPVLTTDEILACLTLVVTLVGILVAVAAIGIGAAAIFGYAELRTMTFRKTEDQLRQIINRLVATGDLSEATARILQESIEVEPLPLAHGGSLSRPVVTKIRSDASATATPKPYPKDDEEKT